LSTENAALGLEGVVLLSFKQAERPVTIVTRAPIAQKRIVLVVIVLSFCRIDFGFTEII
jgi:hypothetical protein